MLSFILKCKYIKGIASVLVEIVPGIETTKIYIFFLIKKVKSALFLRYYALNILQN